MPKIYWLSDGPYLQTGYATISRKLLEYLSKLGWECHYQSHTAQHQPFMPGVELEDGEKLNFKIYGSGRRPYAVDLLVPTIRRLKPDIFGVLLDTFMLHPNTTGHPSFLDLDFSPRKNSVLFSKRWWRRVAHRL